MKLKFWVIIFAILNHHCNNQVYIATHTIEKKLERSGKLTAKEQIILESGNRLRLPVRLYIRYFKRY